MTNFKRLLMLIVAIATLSLNSCKKDKFDEPPTETVDPNIPVTHTIRQLKDLFTGANIQLTDDIVISGVVVANDKSGNIYNQIIIDDGTAGISVAIDQNALYGEFPVGRKIYVKCKDLYLAADNNLLGLYGAIDLAGSTVEIASGLITKYIVKANTGNAVVPIEINNISRLNDSFQNRLITLKKVEFKEADAQQPYADAVNKSSLSRVIQDCSGSEIEARTSGYATFASTLTPDLNGDITGIYTVYRTDKQIILRDVADVNMTDSNRCVPIIVYNPVTIDYLRTKFTGSTVAVGENVLISGIVISSVRDSNNLAQNMTIQDGNAGIVVRLSSSNPNFNKGDAVEIKITSGYTLQRFSNGSLQVGTVQNANVRRVSSNNTVTPQTVDIATLNANFNDYESELVSVTGVTITSSSSTYSSTLTFSDGTGTIASFVRTATMVPSAEFVGQALPSGVVTVVGYANLNGGTRQLILRNLSDVTP